MPEVHQRDSLVSVVHKKVNNTYIDRTHTEKLHRGSDPACSFGGVDTLLIFDSIYVEKFTDVEVHDTVVVTHRDTITIPVPVEPPIDHSPRRRFLALSERARVWVKGFLIGGIGAILLAILAYIANRFYHHR